MDLSGRIYVTHPLYGATHPNPVRATGVYRVNPDGSVALIITDAARPNGIAICPDEAHLYIGSYDYQAKTEPEMALLRYDLAPDGSAANRQVLVDYTPEHGPDGLVCDAEGNLWVAVRNRSRPGIYAYSVADGVARERAYIPTPELPTNLHFGRGDAPTICTSPPATTCMESASPSTVITCKRGSRPCDRGRMVRVGPRG